MSRIEPLSRTSPARPCITAVLLLALVLLLATPGSHALDIQFDYSLDTNNFFVGHLDRQMVLEQAAQLFESRLIDSLTGISPGGSNSWTAIFDHPSTGAEVQRSNPTIPADTLRVYAGARSLSGSNLGIGGPGGFSAGGTQAFLDAVVARGQTGALAQPPTDFGPWGGSITFDLGTSWYFDPDSTTTESFGSSSDFYSVAAHEIAHLLGFGTADSWRTYEGAVVFSGPASTAENFGVPVPLSGDGGHWADGTQSRVTSPVMLLLQEAAMDPVLTQGTRKYFTELDFAGLGDVGWMVVPEPAAIGLLLCGGLLVRWRKGLPQPRS